DALLVDAVLIAPLVAGAARQHGPGVPGLRQVSPGALDHLARRERPAWATDERHRLAARPVAVMPEVSVMVGSRAGEGHHHVACHGVLSRRDVHEGRGRPDGSADWLYSTTPAPEGQQESAEISVGSGLLPKAPAPIIRTLNAA